MSLKVNLPSSNYNVFIITAGLERDIIHCDFMQRKCGGVKEGRAALE